MKVRVGRKNHRKCPTSRKDFRYPSKLTRHLKSCDKKPCDTDSSDRGQKASEDIESAAKSFLACAAVFFKVVYAISCNVQSAFCVVLNAYTNVVTGHSCFPKCCLNARALRYLGDAH